MVKLAAGRENAVVPVALTVVLPPGLEAGAAAAVGGISTTGLSLLQLISTELKATTLMAAAIGTLNDCMFRASYLRHYRLEYRGFSQLAPMLR